LAAFLFFDRPDPEQATDHRETLITERPHRRPKLTKDRTGPDKVFVRWPAMVQLEFGRKTAGNGGA
jgi:hypothetical protein